MPGGAGVCEERRSRVKAAVIVFPGSNCDRDVAVALGRAIGRPPAMIWHGDSTLPALDLSVLPGQDNETSLRTVQALVTDVVPQLG